MSCALASPENGVCANKRPVRGRRAAMQRVEQPPLTPLAAGHAIDSAPTQSPQPFAADAPESTFSLTQARERVPVAPASTITATAVPEAVAHTPRSLPTFREIRAGRAAAAGRTPVAELRISSSVAESGTLIADAAEHAPHAMQCVMPGMEQLVERVRQRTAARLQSLSQSSS